MMNHEVNKYFWLLKLWWSDILIYHRKITGMSSAFVKESDDQWLQDIAPTMNALINFLTRETMAFLCEKKNHSRTTQAVKSFQ
jgi:hypothetical protein